MLGASGSDTVIVEWLVEAESNEEAQQIATDVEEKTSAVFRGMAGAYGEAASICREDLGAQHQLFGLVAVYPVEDAYSEIS